MVQTDIKVEGGLFSVVLKLSVRFLHGGRLARRRKAVRRVSNDSHFCLPVRCGVKHIESGSWSEAVCPYMYKVTHGRIPGV